MPLTHQHLAPPNTNNANSPDWLTKRNKIATNLIHIASSTMPPTWSIKTILYKPSHFQLSKDCNKLNIVVLNNSLKKLSPVTNLKSSWNKKIYKDPLHFISQSPEQKPHCTGFSSIHRTTMHKYNKGQRSHDSTQQSSNESKESTTNHRSVPHYICRKKLVTTSSTRPDILTMTDSISVIPPSLITPIPHASSADQEHPTV